MALLGGGRSFGECAGECHFDLTIAPLASLEDNECFAITVTLEVGLTDGRKLVFEGQLSDQAWEQAATLSRALQNARLEPVSGCPDCSDGGAAMVRRRAADGSIVDHGYEYGNPPEPLREADAFVQALIDQLRACSGPLIDRCEHTDTIDGEPPPSGSCGFLYEDPVTLSAARCEFPAATDAPCRAAVDCLCRTGALEPAMSDPQACIASWLAPRGAPTFADFCASSAASATLSLTEALTSFAATYDARVTIDPGCDQVRAYY